MIDQQVLPLLLRQDVLHLFLDDPVRPPHVRAPLRRILPASGRNTNRAIRRPRIVHHCGRLHARLHHGARCIEVNGRMGRRHRN